MRKADCYLYILHISFEVVNIYLINDENNLAAFFEIVSPFNTIVLKYKTTELKLLQIRDENTGEFLDIYKHPLVQKYNVDCAAEEPIESIESLMQKAKITEFKEGWVVHFNTGKIAKVKTDWYLALHSIMSDGLKEHIIIEHILNETIDDVLSAIPEENVDERNFINTITEIVDDYINKTSNLLYNNVNGTYNGDRKQFAIDNKGDPFFDIKMKLCGNNTIEMAEKLVIAKVLDKTKRLEMARSWLRDQGFVLELKEKDFD